MTKKKNKKNKTNKSEFNDKEIQNNHAEDFVLSEESDFDLESDMENTKFIAAPKESEFNNEVDLSKENLEDTNDIIDSSESFNQEEYQDAIVEELISDETEYIDSTKIEEEIQLREIEEELEELEEYDEEIKVEKETEGLFSKFLGCLGNLIFLIFIAIMAFIIIINGISFLKGKEPTIFGYKMYVVGEDSMNPTIKKNDAIIVKEVEPSELKVGDLITYTSKNEKETITGWVSEIYDNDRFEVKKKMNSDQSVVINGIAIIGVATYRIANMGEFIDFISHPLGIGLVIVVGIIIYIIMWLINRNRKNKYTQTE